SSSCTATARGRTSVATSSAFRSTARVCSFGPRGGTLPQARSPSSATCSRKRSSARRPDGERVVRSRQRVFMRTRTHLLSTIAGLAVGLLFVAFTSWSRPLDAPFALKGQVSSAEEGPMEGVVVSAKMLGSTVTTSVVSDTHGRYTFVRDRLTPGHYSLSIRAVGYEMAGASSVDVAPNEIATMNLTLRPAHDLTAQLTNAEWLAGMPGPDDQKAALLNCTVCHTLERIVRSKHDAAAFVPVLERMAAYTNSSFPLHTQKRPARWLLAPRGDALQRSQQRL